MCPCPCRPASPTETLGSKDKARHGAVMELDLQCAAMLLGADSVVVVVVAVIDANDDRDDDEVDVNEQET